MNTPITGNSDYSFLTPEVTKVPDLMVGTYNNSTRENMKTKIVVPPQQPWQPCGQTPLFSKSVEDARNAILTSSVGGEASWHPEDVYNYLQQNNIPSEIETMDISTSGAQQQFYELIKDKIDN